MFDIEEELKKIPSKPGVYIMHDSGDNIIYVGKAKLLNRRVKQYFQSSRNHSPKIQRMVGHISWFEYIITDSEAEALVLESNLIKENNPKYNTMLTDDKSYPFIKVTVREAFPRIVLSRDARHDDSRYFGPFPSSFAVKETIDFLCRLYALRTCRRKLPRDIGKERPCLNHHIGRCSAPCAGVISEEEYKRSVAEALDFLKGNRSALLSKLKENMLECSNRMEYEEAAKWRDLISSMKKITEKQKITDESDTDRDIVGFCSDGSDAVVQVFFMRSGKLLGRDTFHMRVAALDGDEEIASQFLKQYYGSTPYVPPDIYIQENISEADLIGEWLSSLKGKKVSVITPKRGNKEKLVSLAINNAKLVMQKDKERLRREEAKTTGALREITDILGISPVSRVEAYDISNTSGVESTGSMVVFENGRPKKHDYRRFRIKTVKGPDDYKSMYEVLTRRFKRALDANEDLPGEVKNGFAALPGLILMDGGKGQVGVALRVLDELGIDIPVAGMVKDDRHRTRGLYFNDELKDIDTHSEGFKLITRVQDEAHRFAISYHKGLRSKLQVNSVLDDIKEVGPQRRMELMRHFKDIEKIREASIEQLLEVPKITKSAAQNIYSYFH